MWGLLNHLRLTHPSAAVITSQLVEEQPVDRTLTSSEEACKPDRCSGAVAAAISNDHTGGGNAAHSQDMVSLGPNGSIRCTSPVQRSPRPQEQQQKKRHATKSPCPYHDHETITVSLVGQANMYAAPARAISPQRSHRNGSPSKRQDGVDSCADGAYVRLVSVRPALGQQHGDLQNYGRSAQQQAAPSRCSDPAAASDGSRKAALAQLRMARRRQQKLLPAEVQQQISAKMHARTKQGSKNHWSSRKSPEKQQEILSDAGEAAAP